MLPTLLHIPGISLTVSQQGIHTRDTVAQVWPARHDLDVVDYKALIGLLLLRVPHFHTRCGASLKDLNPDTTSVSKAKCFPVSR
jgi:hypothetical protein